YRPDRWGGAEFVSAASGLAAGAAVITTGWVDGAGLNPSLTPLSWPQLPWLAVLGVGLALLPVMTAPAAPATPGQASESPVGLAT
ncbi:MAG TPA: energy-coupling factor transporter transmembrane protein EcfT, partial [Pseudonocardiaceae bacterium]|nr:energy-coupling factor transporter transmembrane protein EcfT [Pseudonocardiaceae bacterium]